jgi:hypothetical protein
MGAKGLVEVITLLQLLTRGIEMGECLLTLLILSMMDIPLPFLRIISQMT